MKKCPFCPFYAKTNGELGIVHGDPALFSLLIRQKPPFSINDRRFTGMTPLEYKHHA